MGCRLPCDATDELYAAQPQMPLNDYFIAFSCKFKQFALGFGWLRLPWIYRYSDA
jgi:hypothetical protein